MTHTPGYLRRRDIIRRLFRFVVGLTFTSTICLVILWGTSAK